MNTHKDMIVCSYLSPFMIVQLAYKGQYQKGLLPIIEEARGSTDAKLARR